MPHENQIAWRIEVAGALGHLLSLNQEEAGVHPETREEFSGLGFRLRDFVLVMRKDQVFAAGMDVEGFAQILHRHGGALDVPARTARSDLGLPRSFARLWRLP